MAAQARARVMLEHHLAEGLEATWVGDWGDMRAGPGQSGPPPSGTSAGAQSLPLLEDFQARGSQLAWILSSPAPSLCLQMGTQPA